MLRSRTFNSAFELGRAVFQCTSLPSSAAAHSQDAFHRKQTNRCFPSNRMPAHLSGWRTPASWHMQSWPESTKSTALREDTVLSEASSEPTRRQAACLDLPGHLIIALLEFQSCLVKCGCFDTGVTRRLSAWRRKARRKSKGISVS